MFTVGPETVAALAVLGGGQGGVMVVGVLAIPNSVQAPV